MNVSPDNLIGIEISERLRIAQLIEERPFSYLFRGDVLALSRTVGSCSVTIYKPLDKVDPDDIVSSLRATNKDLSNSRAIFGLQQVGVIRQGEHSGLVYATGEPVETTLSLDLKAGKLLGVEEAESLLCQVARAIQGIRDVEEVHGRVRPYNIVRTPEGWKLSGLDLASLEERLERFCRFSDEPVYLPPENYRSGLYGPPVDTWALGICLHLGMCGRIPYPAEEGDLLEQLLKNPPRVERLPGRAGSVVRSLLVTEAEQRWDLQRCIDHIEKPRGDNFGKSPAKSATGDLRSTGQLDGEEGGEKGSAPARALPDNRPLYLRPIFFVLCFLFFVGLTFLGYKTARLPPVPRENKPPEPLYSIDFFQTQVDPDGRLISKSPQQAAAYSEVLGPGNRIEMVQINPGVFEMGSKPNEPYFESDEGPQHPVRVSGIFISRFEITQQQWEAVSRYPKIEVDLPPKPSAFNGADKPVESITWLEAKEFCARLSAQKGRLYRLPTEAEWEFACRAGTETPFCFGETINSALANYQATKPYAHEGKGQYRRETIPVGSLDAANYFGLYDVHGNVAEWCEDRFGDYPDAFIVDPTGPKEGKDRVVRGGSWRSYPWQCRSAARVGFHQDYRRNDIGFRIVLPRIVMVPAEEG